MRPGGAPKRPRKSQGSIRKELRDQQKRALSTLRDLELELSRAKTPEKIKHLRALIEIQMSKIRNTQEGLGG